MLGRSVKVRTTMQCNKLSSMQSISLLPGVILTTTTASGSVVLLMLCSTVVVLLLSDFCMVLQVAWVAEYGPVWRFQAVRSDQRSRF